MNILETYFTYAKLSQAAYIDLSRAVNPLDAQEIVDAASSAAQQRVPSYLAKDIFGVDVQGGDYWTMLSPYYKTGGITGHSDPSSGFAGMLLTNPTYGKVLAIAGTEPTSGNGTQFVQDLLFSDLDQLGFLGAAFNQMVSLFNYVQELKAPTGDNNVLRLEVVRSLIPPLDGTPCITGGTPLVKVFYTLEAHYDGQGKGQLIADGEKLTKWREAANDAEGRVAA